MKITITQLKQLLVFFILLIILVIYNFYIKLSIDWFVIDFIVRSYSFLLSFLIIFIYSNIDIDNFIDEYKVKYNNKYKYIIFFETVLLPFLIIYVISLLFIVLNNINSKDIIFNSVLSTLDGRFTNIIFYSLIFYIIIKSNLTPAKSVPLFIAGCFLFYFVDKLFYNNIDGSYLVLLFKFIKMFIFFFTIYYLFLNKLFKSLVISTISSVVIISTIILSMHLLFYTANTNDQKKEVAFKMLKYNISTYNQFLLNHLLNTKSYNDIERFYKYVGYYYFINNVDQKNLKALLYSKDINLTEFISKTIYKKSIDLKLNNLLELAKYYSEKFPDKLIQSNNFAKITARFIGNDNKTVIDTLYNSSKSLKLWLFNVIEYVNNPEYIPALINYCVDTDSMISNTAYRTISKISKIDPSTELDLNKNDPRVLEKFIYYYHNIYNKKPQGK